MSRRAAPSVSIALALAGSCVSSTGEAKQPLVRSETKGCRFEGKLTGALGVKLNQKPFVTISSPLRAKVVAVESVNGSTEVKVSFEDAGWQLTGTLVGEPLALYLRRPLIFEGTYLPTTDEPLSLLAASEGSASVTVRLPEEYGVERTFTESLSCKVLGLEPTPNDDGSILALLGKPKARAQLVAGTERVELHRGSGEENSLTIETPYSWEVEVFDRTTREARIRLGRLVGWIRNEFLTPLETMGLLNSGAAGDPNAPTAPWGHELRPLEPKTIADFHAPGLSSCSKNIRVYSGEGGRYVPVGSVLAGTTFSFAEERGELRAIAPIAEGMSAHSLWAKASDLASCRRSEAREIEAVGTQESIELAPEANASNPTSPELPQDILQLALRYEARSSYEMARDAYDVATRVEGVSIDVARRAEERSFYLSLLLGEFDVAERTLFRTTSGSKIDAPRIDLVLRLARVMETVQKEEKVLELLSDKFLARNKEGFARPSLALTHALRARAFDALGNSRKADFEWNAALEISRAVFTNINAGASDRELAILAELAGEALFRRASRLEVEAERLRIPTYEGPRKKDSITQFISAKLAPWYLAKREKLEALSEAYRLILELEPNPPPRWVIAASVHVGRAWGNFVDDFRFSPIPREWKHAPEIPAAYYGMLDSPDEPYRQLAKSAFGVALEWSEKFRIQNEDTRAAEEWLADHFRSEFHLLDEFVPEATLSAEDSFQLAPLERK